MNTTHSRHTCATVSILMIVLMVIPAPMRLLALDLPDEFREEREAIRRAIAGVERQSQPSDTRRQATRSGEVLWQVEGERTWSSSRSGRVSIPTDFGRLTYGFDEGQAYRVETVTEFQALLREPEATRVRLLEEPQYQQPRLLTSATSLPEYREPPARRQITNYIWEKQLILPAVVGGTLLGMVPGLILSGSSFSSTHYLGGITGMLAAIFAPNLIDRHRYEAIPAANDSILAEENQRREDEARAAHEAELMRVRTENQRRREEVREAYETELHRVRAENERREASNRHAAVAVYNLDTGTIDMVWRGDPRLSGRSWPPEVQQ